MMNIGDEIFIYIVLFFQIRAAEYLCDKGAKHRLTNFLKLFQVVVGHSLKSILFHHQVVVGMVLCVISLLTVYMAFLHLLDPWLTKRRQTAYKQHAEEEVCALFLLLNSLF